MGYAEELERVFGRPPYLTAEQLRQIDRYAIDELGLPGLVLMENAGMHATGIAMDMLPAAGGSAIIFCGAGNNGGDGYVIARQLHLAGIPTRVLYSVEIERLGGDAKINATVARRLGIEMEPLLGEHRDWCDRDLAIDALLGTGMRGELRGELAQALERINGTCAKHGIRTLAIDLPSGLNADSGEAAEHTFVAQKTVTFATLKMGFANPSSIQFTGPVNVVSIGIPPQLVNQTFRIE